MALILSMTLVEAEKLKQKGHAVKILPRKQIIVVDGYKRYKIISPRPCRG